MKNRTNSIKAKLFAALRAKFSISRVDVLRSVHSNRLELSFNLRALLSFFCFYTKTFVKDRLMHSLYILKPSIFIFHHF